MNAKVSTQLSTKVRISKVDDVKALTKYLENKCDFDVDLVSGRYVVDAKSFMGIFSLDLSKTLDMVIHTTEDEAKDLLTWLETMNILEK